MAVSRADPCPFPKEDQCQALTLDSWGRRTDIRCKHFAYIEMVGTGHRLCGKHAQMEALSLCLQEGRAKRRPKRPYRYGTPPIAEDSE